MNREDAQKRSDRIKAFREELETLFQEKVAVPSSKDLAAILKHHEELLEHLAKDFDVDTTGVQKQMSWGMRVVSFLGSLALSAAVFFFFYRIWGHITTPVQIFLLIVAPLSMTFAAWSASRKDSSRSFSQVCGVLSLACFILNIAVLGRIFNVAPSPNAFLVWSALALILAYSMELHLLLVAGILCLMGYLSATVGTWSGIYWISFGERPENFIAAGTVIFAIPFVFKHRTYPLFPRYYRLTGMLAVLIATLILANWGRASYLPLDHKFIEYLYQTLGFILSAGLVFVGIRYKWSGMTNLGSTFFTILLYTKFYDWWWNWLPKYLFFLLIGLTAILLLLVLKRIRTSATGAT